jgi:signal transduction histidine kinase
MLVIQGLLSNTASSKISILVFDDSPLYLQLKTNLPDLNPAGRFIKTVPSWAFGLALLAMVVNILYFIYKHQVSVDGQACHEVGGKAIVAYVAPGGAAANAGMLPGDTLLTVDGDEVHEWSDIFHDVRAGDTSIYGVSRNGTLLDLPVVFTSPITFFYGITVTIFILLLLVSAASLYLIYIRPHDPAMRIFFIYLQAFAICQNATYLNIGNPIAIGATIIFFLASCLLGPLLIHFHLLFPRQARIYQRFKSITVINYLAGLLLFLFVLISYLQLMRGQLYLSAFNVYKIRMLSWLTFSYFLAVAVVIYQMITIRDTLSRNQLRLVLIGSFFGIYTAVALVFFPRFVGHISAGHPYFFINAQGIGGLVMIICILIAIFRYRIWDIEVIIRKAMQYVAASLFIILIYLFLLYLVNQLIRNESDLTKFTALAISVILFLVLRDRLQKWIDRLFRRETYDSATVVSGFEEKLAGIYRPDEITTQIALQIDEIFHFKTFMLGLRKEGLTYIPAYFPGNNIPLDHEFQIDDEFDTRLRKQHVFSPGELDRQPPILQKIPGELIIPLLKDNEPFGFFHCGPKQSERTYSIQDIRVLQLIARRVIALFHTAGLYQKDLDRQVMLERERARISQDMHDDVGASLTRISILSELARNRPEVKGETKQWLSQISDTSRSVMEEMSQIIWALNPQNDTLEGLAAFLRRFANEYLEPTSVNHTFNFPGILPVKALTIEARRNIYLVVREALHNVVKHSEATSVTITLEVFEDGFRIGVKDDGKGFDPEHLEFPGNGLVNMRKRMQEIGGTIQIRSEKGKGTGIIVDVTT